MDPRREGHPLYTGDPGGISATHMGDRPEGSRGRSGPHQEDYLHPPGSAAQVADRVEAAPKGRSMIASALPSALIHRSAWKGYSANFVLKLSEKSRRHPKRRPARYQNQPVRPVLDPIDGPNTRPERHSHPFSDSFFTAFSEVRQGFIADSSLPGSLTNLLPANHYGRVIRMVPYLRRP